MYTKDCGDSVDCIKFIQSIYNDTGVLYVAYIWHFRGIFVSTYRGLAWKIKVALIWHFLLVFAVMQDLDVSHIHYLISDHKTSC